MMSIAQFNQKDISTQRSMLRHCVPIDSWVEGLIAQQPYTDLEQLNAAAYRLAQSWTWSEVTMALDKHPRIGEKKAQLELSHAEQASSMQEQAGLNLDYKTEQALLAGNAAYEQKFGFIFLIKAAGLSAAEILVALDYRLLNDVESERKIVTQQLREIALHRLMQDLQP
ncbi:2-oxo-4-hydroxy-4-carboxy-5-ureidoimidazoline decarboxylase [Acinetobacter calcoaceticus]|uniref:2-oxo-4-hydroxy-4-carboxy-5-ureidoimidazoline decarboxylase n=1 Tax=Acinetobacter calcoaceticus TaxID=471 RepID=A0A4V6NJ92_ACICA|nr:2-oxo-4-hydroxy-4-carboxy-5-ureidoimidazoline decarboxylase [Acinetobacter calcoaceticus]